MVFVVFVSGAPWGVGGEASSSLPSVSEEDVKTALRLRRCRLPDLTAKGTGFWVMNRLSPESLFGKQDIVT